MPAIEITGQDLSVLPLRAEAARTADGLAGAAHSGDCHGLDGHSRLVAARARGMDRQTPRDLVHRYNTDGLAGLADRPRPLRQPRLAEAQSSEAAKRVEDGPDLKTDGVARWRRADLRDRIAAKFNVHLHERSVGKPLKKLNFSSMSVRPLHPQSGLAAQQAFTKLRRAGARRNPAGACRQAGRNLVWRMNPPFAMPPQSLPNRSRRHGRRRATCSAPSERTASNALDARRVGEDCPRGTGAALVMPAVGIEAMNKNLAEICQCGCVSAIALLIRAGAGWLGSPQLIVRDNIVLMPLPPTAPELDSVDPSTALRAPRAFDALRSGHLGLSARQFSQPPRLGQLRGDHRGLPRCLERPNGQIRAHYLNWNQRLGTGQNLGRLV